MVDFKDVRYKQYTIRLWNDQCTCYISEVFPDGQGPLWFEHPLQAVRVMQMERKRREALLAQDPPNTAEANFRYFAFHLEHKHVLLVLDGQQQM